MTLTEFLTARIAEDVELVRQLTTGEHAEPSRWRDSRGDIMGETWVLGSRRIAILDEGNQVSSLAGEHIARWDPSRVLAECEAKRRIVDYREQCERDRDEAAEARDLFAARLLAFDATLRALALPYADHPDYDETWRP